MCLTDLVGHSRFVNIALNRYDDLMIKNLVIYVHEFQKEVGHSRALIEILRNYKNLNDYETIHVVAYDLGDMSDLLEQYKGTFKFYRVPKVCSKVFLVKAIFYQIYVFFLSMYLGHHNFLKISMGTAVLHADVSYVQFIQEQAAYFYFESYDWKISPMMLIRYLYKKLLFYYFIFCERVLFSKDKIKIICCGQFMTDYLLGKYKLSTAQVTTIYSSVNFSEFAETSISKVELFSGMLNRYPVLKGLNLEKEIFLFIGAFERKGLKFAISALQKSAIENKQLIVIGMPESGSKLPDHDGINLFWIPHTKEVSKFYELAGVFIFPTIYEPFGLVIVEAFRMGLQIYVTKKHVGACELIRPDDHISFIEDVHTFELRSSSLMSIETKSKLMKDRVKFLNLISWEKSAQEFFAFIT
jgi:glycosyltransferase involved in cell wall biosynthesis